MGLTEILKSVEWFANGMYSNLVLKSNLFKSLCLVHAFSKAVTLSLNSRTDFDHGER